MSKQKYTREKQFVTVEIVGPNVEMKRKFDGETKGSVNRFIKAFYSPNAHTKLFISKNA